MARIVIHLRLKKSVGEERKAATARPYRPFRSIKVPFALDIVIRKELRSVGKTGVGGA
jgi:hypothetical protein